MNTEILESSEKCINGNCVECKLDIEKCPYEFAKAILEHHKKYGWHDLRKKPDDLPDTERMVDVMAKMLCEWDGVYRVFPMQMSYKAKIMYGKPIGWGIGYPYEFDFETDEVIAWREINPFESEDELQ